MAMPHNRTEHELASAQQMNEFWRELPRNRERRRSLSPRHALIRLLHAPDAMQMSSPVMTSHKLSDPSRDSSWNLSLV